MRQILAVNTDLRLEVKKIKTELGSQDINREMLDAYILKY